MTDLSEALLAVARKEAAARSRRLGREERPGALPPAFGTSGGASATSHAQAVITDRAILAALATGSMVVREIAAATGIPAKTISGAMQRIKLAGHCSVTKARSPARGVIHRYALTETGRAFAAEAPNSHAQRVEAVLQMRSQQDETAAVAPNLTGSVHGVLSHITRTRHLTAADGYTERRISLADGVKRREAAE